MSWLLQEIQQYSTASLALFAFKSTVLQNRAGPTPKQLPVCTLSEKYGCIVMLFEVVV